MDVDVEKLRRWLIDAEAAVWGVMGATKSDAVTAIRAARQLLPPKPEPEPRNEPEPTDDPYGWRRLRDWLLKARDKADERDNYPLHALYSDCLEQLPDESADKPTPPPEVPAGPLSVDISSPPRIVDAAGHHLATVWDSKYHTRDTARLLASAPTLRRRLDAAEGLLREVTVWFKEARRHGQAYSPTFPSRIGRYFEEAGR